MATPCSLTKPVESSASRPLPLLDSGAAAIGLILLSPVLVLIALAIAVDDGFPVLFRQERVGRNGKLFQILKFRTMRAVQSGPKVTSSGDSRVTRAGRWLRKLKLDELPQLWNVLRGDMSLIGPRPEVPEYVELDDPLWQTVLSVRPGITDLATLAFRHEEEVLSAAADTEDCYRGIVLPQKLRLNVYYLQSRSPLRDLKLLWLTARYSFFPQGFDHVQILRSLGVADATMADSRRAKPNA